MENELERLRSENSLMRQVFGEIGHNVTQAVDDRTRDVNQLYQYAFQWRVASTMIKGVCEKLNIQVNERDGQ